MIVRLEVYRNIDKYWLYRSNCFIN